MTVIEEIRERRTLLGMTQQQAAARASIPEREWRAIEAGRVDPSGAMLRRMVDAVSMRLALVPKGPTPHLHRSDELRELVRRLAMPDATGCRQHSRRAIAARTGVSRVRVKQI